MIRPSSRGIGVTAPKGQVAGQVADLRAGHIAACGNQTQQHTRGARRDHHTLRAWFT